MRSLGPHIIRQQFPDGEHHTFISTRNTFALVGWAIRLTEALFLGWNKEDGGKTYRLLPGDVKGPVICSCSGT